MIGEDFRAFSCGRLRLLPVYLIKSRKNSILEKFVIKVQT